MCSRRDGRRYVSGINENQQQEQLVVILTKNSIKYSIKYCISGFGLRSLFALAISLTRFPLWLSYERLLVSVANLLLAMSFRAVESFAVGPIPP